MTSKPAFVARYSEDDLKPQCLWEHLNNVADLAGKSAEKVGLGSAGELIGLLHDLGKGTQQFQEYLQWKVGLRNEVTFELEGSKLDHATAGAQFIYEVFTTKSKQYIADILGLIVCSHHGLIDALSPDGKDILGTRLAKEDSKTRKTQALSSLPPELHITAHSLINGNIDTAIDGFLTNIIDEQDQWPEKHFKIGLCVRFLLSCLIDADRTDAANFSSTTANEDPSDGLSWDRLIVRFEQHLESFSVKNQMDQLRKDISEKCRVAAEQNRGFFRLTVPTGGGKTLSSLRFALHHAKKHKLQRIFFIIPYTSIIDQNAQRIRDALGITTQDVDIVLEHHSNIIPEKDEQDTGYDARYQVLSENWNSTIILTTMVQFLETLYGPGTSSCRRMHQLANSAIVFDEVQTLPVNIVHLFNLALKFLVQGCNSSIMLCTATQPLLHRLENQARALPFDPTREISVEPKQRLACLSRVNVLDETRPLGWSSEELSELALNESLDKKSVLVIVNTKRKAANVFKRIRQAGYSPVYHLSTSLCPAHRLVKIDEVNKLLDHRQPLILVSTQLIEAGVDVDFDVVIRSVAGLDSIAQAAGRCNRHGSRPFRGRVIIVNSSEENLSRLPEIACAKRNTERILAEFNADATHFQGHLLGDKALERYFVYYYHSRNNEMDYPVTQKTPIGRTDNLIELLSCNTQSVRAYRIAHNNENPNRFLRQSFSSATKSFVVIPDSGHGVLVPYGKGVELIAELAGVFDPNHQRNILRRAQRYSVNCFHRELVLLGAEQGLRETQKDSGILYLDEQFYHDDLGLTVSKTGEMSVLNI